MAKPSALTSTLNGLSSTLPHALIAAAQWKLFPLSTLTKISIRLLVEMGVFISFDKLVPYDEAVKRSHSPTGLPTTGSCSLYKSIAPS
jgi:hypothetical protein